MKKIAVIVCLSLCLSLLVGCSNKEKEIPSPVVDKTLFNEAKTYDSSQTYPSGSITVSDVVIKNAVFEGDLVIEASVGDGNVTLSSVKILGNLLVRGGGEHSIHLDDCTINEIQSNRAEGKVRIVVSENTTVETMTVGSATNLEVDGSISSLNVSEMAKGSDISIQPLANVGSVDILGKSTLNIQSEITTLNLKAESTVTIGASIKNVNVEQSAGHTTMTMSAAGKIGNLATETKIDISGTGKIDNLFTSDKTYLTGNLQPDSIVVSKNPLQETMNKPEVTEKPVVVTTDPIIKPTVTTKPTETTVPVYTSEPDKPIVEEPAPTVVPTTVPTPAPTVIPTTVPTPTPTVIPTIVPTPTPTVVPTNVPTPTPTVIPTENPNITTVKTKEELQQALSAKKPEIVVQGTLGSENEYTIYRIEDKTVIRGETGNKIYGSLIVDADEVTIDGLEIHNEGWSSGPTDARRNAINVISNHVTLTNNKLVSSLTSQTTSKISNGISLTASTDINTSLNIKDNEIIGFGYDNPAWSSTGIIISAGIVFPYEATNTHGQTHAVELSADFSKIANQNKITNCYNDLIYGDYGNNVGFYTQKYSYVSNVFSLVSALVYSHPTHSVIELAANSYTITKADAEAEFPGTNGLVVKPNVELVIPTTSILNLDADVKLIVEVGGKLTNSGKIVGSFEDKNIMPQVTNATLSYNAISEDITLNFNLDKGFELEVYEDFKTMEEVGLAYYDFIKNNTVEVAKKLKNDILFTYYTKNADGQVEFLKSSSSTDLIKSKVWGGYLIYIENGIAYPLKPGNIPGLEATSLGLTVPDHKLWRTCTNPITGTVSKGWLDGAKGKTVYVDIIVLYNGNIIKETVSIDIPAPIEITPKIENASLTYTEASEDLTVQFDLDKGYVLETPNNLTTNEIDTLRYNLLSGVTEDAKTLKNDLILAYYTKDSQDVKTYLKTSTDIDLIKNKLWNGYLFYDGVTRIPNGNNLEGNTTSMGVTLPDHKSWITCTNPQTGTVTPGWLNAIKGQTVYVDIIAIYNGQVIINTVSTVIDASGIIRSEPLDKSEEIQLPVAVIEEKTEVEPMATPTTLKEETEEVVEVHSDNEQAEEIQRNPIETPEVDLSLEKEVENKIE